MQTPDLMPILSYGDHDSPAEGACIMEMASFLAGEEWTDEPACVHPVLAGVARAVNDKLSGESRQSLLPLLPRLMGTTALGHSDSLASWLLARVPADETRHYASAARDEFKAERYANAAEWAMWAIHSCSLTGDARELLPILTGLLDEYDLLTGRSTAAPLSPEQHRSLVELTTP